MWSLLTLDQWPRGEDRDGPEKPVQQRQEDRRRTRRRRFAERGRAGTGGDRETERQPDRQSERGRRGGQGAGVERARAPGAPPQSAGYRGAASRCGSTGVE